MCDRELVVRLNGRVFYKMARYSSLVVYATILHFLIVEVCINLTRRFDAYRSVLMVA